MILSVKAKPGSSRPEIIKETENSWIIRVKESPENGKANEAVKRMIAEEPGVPASKVRLSRGHSSKNKIFEIDI